MSATPSPQRNGPGVPLPQATQQTKLKSIVISGTNLRWTAGEEAPYLDAEAKWQIGIVMGLGIITPPPEQQAAEGGNYVQINIIYEHYRDLYVAADHLVIKNLHVSELLVPVTQLAVPGR